MAGSDSLLGPAECSFCGAPNHLDAGGDHPCCVDARRRGLRICEGCVNFAAREACTCGGCSPCRQRQREAVVVVA